MMQDIQYLWRLALTKRMAASTAFSTRYIFDSFLVIWEWQQQVPQTLHSK